MRRREFIAVMGGAAAWPMTARSQQSEQMRRIGVLMNAVAGDPQGQARIAAFQQTLQQLGWSEGRNVWSIASPALRDAGGAGDSRQSRTMTRGQKRELAGGAASDEMISAAAGAPIWKKSLVAGSRSRTAVPETLRDARGRGGLAPASIDGFRDYRLLAYRRSPWRRCDLRCL